LQHYFNLKQWNSCFIFIGASPKQPKLIMPAIQYRLVQHRGESCIVVLFPPNAAWNKRMRTVHGAKWSQTLKGWTIPDTAVNREKCGLPGAPPSPSVQAIAHTSKTPVPRLSANNYAQLQLFIQQLQLKAYSPSTIRTYRNEFMQLLQLIGYSPVQDLQPPHLQRYLLYCLKNGLTENSIHSRMNALKFYYEQVLHKEKMFFDIPRPKKPIQLPKVLNETELKRMFAAIKNIKHKAILFTAYSAGLRVSEVVNLRVQDIDSKRMQIFIQRAKGKKDRVVPLSVLVLDVLFVYLPRWHNCL
jgi:integrase/recombinase XerD